MKINTKNNVALLLIILGVMCFFMFIMPIVDDNYYKQNQEDFNPTSNTPISNNDSNIVKLDTQKCSTSCCGLKQWPVPSELLDPSMSQDELNNYIPSNFGCASGDYGGCLCMTQQNSNYLNNHGSNM